MDGAVVMAWRWRLQTLKSADAKAIVEVRRILTDAAQSHPPALFSVDPTFASSPGLYSWWADEVARKLISEVLLSNIPPLIYAGQAGATQWPSARKSSATLASRIRANHINGNATSSTFRLTLSAILMEPMQLRLGKPGRLAAGDRKKVSGWMKEHLRVAIAPYDDRDSLEDLEKDVLVALDPPLNLQGMPQTPARRRLSHLRKRITNG